MIKREQLNKLVVFMLKDNELSAKEIYHKIKIENHEIIHEERVRSFKGFVKILNSFSQVQPIGRKGEAKLYKSKI